MASTPEAKRNRRNDDGELGDQLRELSGGDDQSRRGIADEEGPDVVDAEARVEIGPRRRAGSSGGNGIVGAGIGRPDVHPEDVDRRPELIEGWRGPERVEERRARRVEVGLLPGGESFGEQHDIERTVPRGASEDLRGSNDGAVRRTHLSSLRQSSRL